ncbi:hypothetical protein DFH11DRAFT_1686730 [Phellopilus nigrolimitatus]|nr:hypothetical protein DFH11DRAFT_1686730 [Phellopilus nigrolimitatus]
MDDDLGFGTDIWATPSSETATSKLKETSPQQTLRGSTPPPQTEIEFHDDAFADDIFESGAPIQASTLQTDDDEFGDFGDFGDAVEGESSSGFGQSTTFGDGEVFFATQATADWDVLRLDPFPSTSTLKTGIGDALKPLWDTINPSQFLTDEDIRQVGGLNQILVTPESRSLYSSLYQSPPNTQPTNWTRSRIRRRHLVSLGIPVNLDEVLPHVNGKPLPALQITTRPLSAPPGPRALNRVTSPPLASVGGSRPSSRPGSRPASRSGTPKPSPLAQASSFIQLGLGPKPEIDETGINEMLAMGQDTLTLLPLSTLEAHLAHIRSLTADTSDLLTHLLQQRDALQQDSETYNKLIAELVRSGPKTRNGGGRRASGMT